MEVDIIDKINLLEKKSKGLNWIGVSD